MPRAIISPSVLASDFGQLTAECKRMIKGGAEWLHMGASHCDPHGDERSLTTAQCRCYGRVCLPVYRLRHVLTLVQDISCPTSRWVSTLCTFLRPRSNLYTLGAPILSCVSKGVPGIFMDCHMMVSEPEKVRLLSRSDTLPCITRPRTSGWTTSQTRAAHCTASATRPLVRAVDLPPIHKPE